MGFFSFWDSHRPDDIYTTPGHPDPDPIDLSDTVIYKPSPEWRGYDLRDHEDDDDNYHPYSFF